MADSRISHYRANIRASSAEIPCHLSQIFILQGEYLSHFRKWSLQLWLIFQEFIILNLCHRFANYTAVHWSKNWDLSLLLFSSRVWFFLSHTENIRSWQKFFQKLKPRQKYKQHVPSTLFRGKSLHWDYLNAFHHLWFVKVSWHRITYQWQISLWEQYE